MTAQRRQALLLAVLIVLVAWYGWQRIFAGGGGAIPGVSSVSATRGARARGPERVAELDIQRLSPASGVFTPGRDVFRYAAPSAPDVPAPTVEPETSPASSPQSAPSTEQATGPDQPTPPHVDLIYLGSFGPDDAPIVVFTDQKSIINARQGDVLDGKFVVRNIGYESVDLGFVGFPDDVVQRLGPGR